LNNNEPSIALVSVIVSGIVAISSVVFPILLNLISESSKWKREKNLHIIEIINSTTINLLDTIADFRSGDVREATGETTSKKLSDAISNYYSWERAIWQKLNTEDQNEIKKLRKKFEDADYHSLFSDGPSLADQILDISAKAIDRTK
jgi:hypothetical protein